jgi:hypothetical protein
VDHVVAELRLAPMPDQEVVTEQQGALGNHATPDVADGRQVVPVGAMVRTSGPDRTELDQACRSADQDTTDWSGAGETDSVGEDNAEDVDAAAVAAYRVSIDTGVPLSERKLASMFGKTSRRWARNRMAEACQTFAPALADSR